MRQSPSLQFRRRTCSPRFDKVRNVCQPAQFDRPATCRPRCISLPGLLVSVVLPTGFVRHFHPPGGCLQLGIKVVDVHQTGRGVPSLPISSSARTSDAIVSAPSVVLAAFHWERVASVAAAVTSVPAEVSRTSCERRSCGCGCLLTYPDATNSSTITAADCFVMPK